MMTPLRMISLSEDDGQQLTLPALKKRFLPKPPSGAGLLREATPHVFVELSPGPGPSGPSPFAPGSRSHPMRRVTIGTLLLLCVSASGAAQETRELNDKAKITELSRQAQEAWDAKKWDDAITSYRAVVKLDPNNAIAWHHLGYALHTLGRLDEALEAHLKAAEMRQTKPIGLYNAGCVYALKKDKDKAFEFLMKAAGSGFGQTDQLDADEDLASLRDDPRWAKLVAAVKAAEEG